MKSGTEDGMRNDDDFKLMTLNKPFCDERGSDRSLNEVIAKGTRQGNCGTEDMAQMDNNGLGSAKLDDGDDKDEEEGDDDYMSDVFTATTSDIRPGIAMGYSQRRFLKIESGRGENGERVRNQPKRAELEQEMREKALHKPISSESKGFALLAKMGYKPGMSLGKQKEGMDEGIKEPITVDFKTGRTGLGHKTQEDERKKLRNELIQKRLAARAKTNQYLVGDYRSRQRAANVQRQLIGDIMKSRKACQDLDLRIGLEMPKSPYFWPIYKQQSSREVDIRGGAPLTKRAHIVGGSPDGYEYADDDNDDYESNDDDDDDGGDDDDEIYKYPNGKLAPAERELNELNETELIDRLEDLTGYLRDEHSYCVWCGCQYEGEEELSMQCPGSTRSDHEEVDGLDE